MPSGRLTKCTPPVVEEICNRLAGGESLNRICMDDHMPDKSNVLMWVVTDRKVEGTEDLFHDKYIQAREAAGFSHADKVADVATRAEEGSIDGHQARAAMDGFKWAAERMAPRKHSPKQNVDHTSSDGSMTPKDNSAAVLDALSRKHGADS